MLDEKYLERFLEKKNVKAEIVRLETETKTVSQAAKALNVERKQIIKTLLFIYGSGKPVIAIVRGDQQVNTIKLANAVKCEKIRIATPQEVKILTGYEVGALPPIAHIKEIKTFIDPAVMEMEYVYGGGGTRKTLLKIKPNDIVNLQNAIIKDIT